MTSRIVLSAILLVCSLRALCCTYEPTVPAELPIDLADLLLTALKGKRITSVPEMVTERGEYGRWFATAELDSGKSEDGAYLVRVMQCVHDSNWTCYGHFERRIEYRGRRITLPAQMAPAEAITLLDEVQALIGRESTEGTPTPLSQSELDLIIGLSQFDRRFGIEVQADLHVNEGCGESLIFRRACKFEEICPLKYIGHFFDV